MKILNISCPLKGDGSFDDQKCHNNLIGSNPNLLSIRHIQNNHILLFNNDYDSKGHHDIQIHQLSISIESGDVAKSLDIASKLGVSINQASVSLNNSKDVSTS